MYCEPVLSTSTQFSLATTTAGEASESEERDRAWSWDREGERAVREDWGRSRRVVHSDTHGVGAEGSVVRAEHELTELHLRRGVWRSANAALKVWWRGVEPAEIVVERGGASRDLSHGPTSWVCAATVPRWIRGRRVGRCWGTTDEEERVERAIRSRATGQLWSPGTERLVQDAW